MGIVNRYLCIVSAALVLCNGSTLSPQQSVTAPNPPNLLIGVWESVQADGSAIGIDLSEVPADLQSGSEPSGDPGGRKALLQVGVFQKRHQRIACGEENFFVIGKKDPDHDSIENFVHGKLQIRYRDHVSGLEIQLVLAYDPFRDLWTGHFRRGKFDGEVELHRASHRPDAAQGGCIITGSRS
jgi:hypothetical protein